MLNQDSCPFTEYRDATNVVDVLESCILTQCPHDGCTFYYPVVVLNHWINDPPRRVEIVCNLCSRVHYLYRRQYYERLQEVRANSTLFSEIPR